MNTKKTIYLIRHGQTDYNKNGIIQGKGINSNINALGKLQAQQFFRAYHHINFDHVYTSTLQRTSQSVQPFIDKGHGTTAMEELDEINWGIFEGRKSTPEEQKEYARLVNDWKAGLLDRAVENGETPNKMQKRQKAGLEKILAKSDENTVLVCMHGRAMRSFLCLLTGHPLHNMDSFEHKNLCLYILEQNGNTFNIMERCSVDHLYI